MLSFHAPLLLSEGFLLIGGIGGIESVCAISIMWCRYLNVSAGRQEAIKTDKACISIYNSACVCVVRHTEHAH